MLSSEQNDERSVASKVQSISSGLANIQNSKFKISTCPASENE